VSTGDGSQEKSEDLVIHLVLTFNTEEDFEEWNTHHNEEAILAGSPIMRLPAFCMTT